MHKISPEDEAKLIGLRDRILLTITFIESSQDFMYGDGVRDAVTKAFEKRSIRNMRLIAREVDAMTAAVEPHQREGLEAILSARLGVDKDAERRRQSEAVAVILTRGSIASEKERRRLEDYADALEASGGDTHELEAIRRLLRA